MMIRFPLISLLMLAGVPVAAHDIQTDQRNAADAAKAFSLDLPAPASAPASEAAAPVPATDTSRPVSSSFTLDTPIALLVADPRAKTVLDHDLPGLSDDPNLPKFQSSSLRQFQPMTGGQLTGAMLSKTAADLAALGDAPPVLAPPLLVPVAGNKRLDGGR